MELKCPIILSVLILVFTGSVANAQELKEAPVSIELVMGNNRFGLQSLINKHLPESRKFSFLSVSNFETGYSNEVKDLDFIMNSQLSYGIYKGLGASVGINVNRSNGLAPAIGIQYVFVNPEWLFVITPAYIFTKDKNASILSLVEYKPSLTKQVKLYSRIQGLYNYNLRYKTHERSYLQVRLGIEIKRYQFGLAGNLDYFGSKLFFRDNYGVFIRVNL